MKIVGKIDLPSDTARFRHQKPTIEEFIAREVIGTRLHERLEHKVLTEFADSLIKNRQLVLAGRKMRLTKSGIRRVQSFRGSVEIEGRRAFYMARLSDGKEPFVVGVCIVHRFDTSRGVVYFFEKTPWIVDEVTSTNACFTQHFLDRYVERTGCDDDDYVKAFVYDDIFASRNAVMHDGFVQSAFASGTGLGIQLGSVNGCLFITFVSADMETRGQAEFADKRIERRLVTYNPDDMSSMLSPEEMRAFMIGYNNCKSRQ